MNPVFCRRPADTPLFYARIFAGLSIVSIILYFLIDSSNINFNSPEFFNQTVEMIDSSTGGIATFLQFEIIQPRNREISILAVFINKKNPKATFSSDFAVTFLKQGGIFKKFYLKKRNFFMNQRSVLYKGQNIKFDALSINVECKTLSDPTTVFEADVCLNSDKSEIRQILLHSIFSISNGVVLILLLLLWKDKLRKARNPLFVTCLGLFTHLCGVKSLISDNIFEAVVNHLFRTACHFFCYSNRSFLFFVLMFIEFLITSYADLVTPVLKTRIYDFASYAWIFGVEIALIFYYRIDHIELVVFLLLSANEVISSFVERAEEPRNWFVLPTIIPNLFGFYFTGKAIDNSLFVREHSSQKHLLLREEYSQEL